MPISMDWSKDEVVQAVNFYEAIDQAYGKGIERERLLSLYNQFKQIVPSKSEEKQHFKDYEKQSGQSAYHVVKKAKEYESGDIIVMK
ncbi:UPF0223 family protein [Salipaludibacillus agaradhaerens]|uniref:UPF0223 family protein n=2 Tax=Salipaludibacillus agaradhaerens TaxID=76935 RepID=A0A9Q4B061_SALAG|nr:UPF0223 family protein [Salipaludibacillus agaradhaerens]MCR6095894.1 UPF0223 family protein [Salipaludibacillus agaradhaerens]MCR6114547.1 UPF0223 family protein [Salipaludibacillus agaradhaerens]